MSIGVAARDGKKVMLMNSMTVARQMCIIHCMSGANCRFMSIFYVYL